MLGLNDPVTVNRDGQRQLEGVVAFLGKVAFSSAEDWVGVRLTGASVGLGKNDGSVQGQRYFDCPAGCGIFVKKSALTKRQLTRLEELRLRRELAQGPDAPSTAATSTPSGKGGSTPKTPSSQTRSATATKTPSSTSSSSGANRLEELRQRLAEHQAEADALAFEAYIEFTKVRAALVRALTDLPEAPEAIR